MRGQLKFVDGKTGKWGFIVPDDGGKDIHFVQSDVTDGPLTRSQAGADLAFDLEESTSGRHARNIRIVADETSAPPLSGTSGAPAPIPVPPPASSIAPPADELRQWAFMVFADFTGRDGRIMKSVLPTLASMALEERWYFGKNQDPRNPFPILENYIKSLLSKTVVESVNKSRFGVGW